MLPALINQIVVILKDTSLAAVLGLYTELLRQGNLIALNLSNPIQILSVVGVIFILINYSLSRLATWVDQRSVRRTQSQSAARTPAVCVGAEAPDGYRAVFALPEADTSFATRTILVSDRRDGAPTLAWMGPLQVVVPGEKEYARWVRQVRTLRVRRL